MKKYLKLENKQKKKKLFQDSIHINTFTLDIYKY